MRTHKPLRSASAHRRYAGLQPPSTASRERWHLLGELLLAPMGLALVTRMVPRSGASRMVAMWFAATAAGNGLAGGMGLLWTRLPHRRYFALLALLALGAAAVPFARLERLERLLRADRQPQQV